MSNKIGFFMIIFMLSHYKLIILLKSRKLMNNNHSFAQGMKKFSGFLISFVVSI